MNCAQCSEKILSKPVVQGNESFCSLECANLAAGFDPDEEIGYYDKDEMMEEFFEDINE